MITAYRSELGRALSDQSGDILALELRDELPETLLISLNANGTEDLLDIVSRRGGVATDLEEEVCSEMTHLSGTEGLVSSCSSESTRVPLDALSCSVKVESRGKPQITATEITQNGRSTPSATVYSHLILKGRPVDSIRRR